MEDVEQAREVQLELSTEDAEGGGGAKGGANHGREPKLAREELIR